MPPQAPVMLPSKDSPAVVQGRKPSWKAVAVGFFASLFVGGGAWWWWRSRQSPQSLSVAASPPSPLPPPPPPSILKKALRTTTQEATASMAKTALLQLSSAALPLSRSRGFATIQRASPSENLRSVISARSALDRFKSGDPSLLGDGAPAHSIEILNWQDVDELASLLQVLFLHAASPKVQGAEAAGMIRRFFLRHSFVVPVGSEVYQDQQTTLLFLEDRPVESSAWMAKASSWQGDFAASNQEIPTTRDYIKHLGCIPAYFPALSPESKAKIPSVLQDGLLLLFETCLPRVANWLAVLSSNPQGQSQVAAKIVGGIGPLAGAAIQAALAAAGVSSAVPVVGWITAAVAAAGAALIAIFDFVGQVNRREEFNLAWQAQVQQLAEDVWVKGLQRPLLQESLLGYQLGLLSNDPAYPPNESRSRSPWLRNFCLVRGGPHVLDPCSERLFPQIPFFVRQIRHAMAIQSAAGYDAWVCLDSRRAWIEARRVVCGWVRSEIEYKNLPQNLGWLRVST